MAVPSATIARAAAHAVCVRTLVSWRKSLPGLLFSPARGLVWFSPVLLLGLVSAVAL